MRRLSLVLGALMLLSIIAIPGHALAAPTSQVITTDTTILCEAYVTDGYVPVSSSTAAYQLYSTELGGGADAHPGYVFWGNASSSTVGTFGIARVKLSLSDLVGEVADYYLVNVYTDGLIFRWPASTPLSMVPGSGPGHTMSSRVGWGYDDPELGGAYCQVGDWGPQEEGPKNFYEDINMTLESRPWSLAEVNAMYVEIDLRFDAEAVALVYGSGGAIRQILTYVHVWVEPAAYTPAPESTPTAGSFILRPETDGWTDGDISFTEATAAGSINETNYHSDGDVSYLNKSDTLGETGQQVCYMSDPPSWLLGSGNRYFVYPWIIARDDDPTGPEKYLFITLGIAGAMYVGKQIGPDLQEGWYNNTPGRVGLAVPTDYPGGPRLDWGYAELKDMRLQIVASGASAISQLAVLCVISYIPPIDSDFGGVIGWLGEGHGILTVIGIFGFLGMIAVPVMAFVAYREDGEVMMTIGGALILMVLFGGFFLVGLSGSWG